MKTWLINRFYWPDEPATALLAGDLCEALTREGHGISVVCSGRPGAESFEQHQGVQIHRVSIHGLSVRSLPGKARDYSRYLIALKRFLSANLNKGDIVIALTDPPLLGAFIAGLVRRRGAHLIQWMQDIYPEVALSVTNRRALHWGLSCFAGARNRSLTASRACVTLGSDMGETLIRGGLPRERLHLIPNWAPEGLSPADPLAVRKRRMELGIDDAFTLCYSGNIGRVHEVAALAKLAGALKQETGIRFIFIGEGARRPELQQALRMEGVRNALFLPPCPRSDLAESLCLADLHLVTLKPGCEGSVFPSKLYGIAAVGRPVLFFGSPGCDIALQISDAGMGESFAPGEIDQAVRFVRTLVSDRNRALALGSHARRFHEASGGLALAARRWASLIGSIASVTDAATLASNGDPT